MSEVLARLEKKGGSGVLQEYYCHIWTKSTGGNNAALYVTEIFTYSDGTVEYLANQKTLVYTGGGVKHSALFFNIGYDIGATNWYINAGKGTGLTVNGVKQSAVFSSTWSYSTNVNYEITA